MILLNIFSSISCIRFFNSIFLNKYSLTLSIIIPTTKHIIAKNKTPNIITKVFFVAKNENLSVIKYFRIYLLSCNKYALKTSGVVFLNNGFILLHLMFEKIINNPHPIIKMVGDVYFIKRSPYLALPINLNVIFSSTIFDNHVNKIIPIVIYFTNFKSNLCTHCILYNAPPTNIK